MIVTLTACSGLRRGELFALKWEDLDQDAAMLRVRRSNYQGAITAPKTRELSSKRRPAGSYRHASIGVSKGLSSARRRLHVPD
jgi:integrase